MQALTFTYHRHLLPSENLIVLLEYLRSYQQQLVQNYNKGYATPYASLVLPDDVIQYNQVRMLVERKKKTGPMMLIVIGIGGSNLGVMAVHQACLGSFYEQAHVKVYYVDTVDSDRTHTIIGLMQQALEQNIPVIITAISKSGTTIESIAHVDIFIAILKKYYSNYHEHVVAITDKGSALWYLAQQQQFSCLEIPENVGGRYSIMSPSGLFPLAMMGIDINALMQGARDARNAVLVTVYNAAALSAVTMYYYAQQAMLIHDTFLFSPDLENLGKWYRQLLAESIGKEKTVHGDPVAVNIMPTVSIGSTDLHSMAQFYLSGERNLFTSFVTTKSSAHQIVIPPLFEDVVSFNTLQGKTLDAVMEAILKGVQSAYAKAHRPFITWELPEKNSYYCGQWMQYKMMEVMYLGLLFEINSFDQPQVELYKKETRRLLNV